MSLGVPEGAECRGGGLGGHSFQVLQSCVLHSDVRSLQTSISLLFIILCVYTGGGGQPCEVGSLLQGGDRTQVARPDFTR